MHDKTRESECLQNRFFRLKIMLLTLLFATSVFVQIAAQDFPSDFMDSLPGTEVDTPVVIRRLIEVSRDVDEYGGSERVEILTRLLEFTDDKTLEIQLINEIEKAIDACDDVYAVKISHIAGRFPEFFDKVLAKAKDAETEDKVRSGFAQHLADFDRSRGICDAIQSPRVRCDTLAKLVYRAPTLKMKLAILESYFAIRTDPEIAALDGDAFDGYENSCVSALTQHAGESPELICEFISRALPNQQAVIIYARLAGYANKTNPSAAKQYLELAWEANRATDKPYQQASMLLQQGLLAFDRKTWMSKFDEYLMPALREGKTGIQSLSYLVRFDIELLIERTRESCVIPERRFEKILPGVMRGAFPIDRQSVLSWLETTDSPLRDACMVKVLSYLDYESHFGSDVEESIVARLCALTLKISDPKERLTALSQLAASLPRLGIVVPQDVLEEGRKLMNGHVDYESIEVWNLDQRDKFWLGTIEQRNQLFDVHIDSFRIAQDRDLYRHLSYHCEFMAKSGIPCDEQLSLLQRVFDLAKSRSDPDLQAKAATAAVACDANWAVKKIWSVLPDDRGRSFVNNNGDWTPPPQTSGDAIGWLRRNLNDPEAELKLMIALWNFLPGTLPEDRDGIKMAVCNAIVERNHFGEALGVANSIQDPRMRSHALIELLAKKTESNRVQTGTGQ